MGMRITSFDYTEDATLDVDQVVLVSTITGGTVLHHPDATDEQIAQGLAALFLAIVERHGAGNLEQGLASVLGQMRDAGVAAA